MLTDHYGLPLSIDTVQFARADTASNSTCAPTSASARWILSASLCDSPSCAGGIAVGSCRRRASLGDKSKLDSAEAGQIWLDWCPSWYTWYHNRMEPANRRYINHQATGIRSAGSHLEGEMTIRTGITC